MGMGMGEATHGRVEQLDSRVSVYEVCATQCIMGWVDGGLLVDRIREGGGEGAVGGCGGEGGRRTGAVAHRQTDGLYQRAADANAGRP